MVRYEKKHLVILVIIFAGVIAAILLVNRWIAREMKDITASLPAEKYSAPQAVGNAQQRASGPRPVVIDPLNDPLAPVVPRSDPKSSTKTAAPLQPSQQKIYEPAMDSVILTQ